MGCVEKWLGFKFPGESFIYTYIYLYLDYVIVYILKLEYNFYLVKKKKKQMVKKVETSGLSIMNYHACDLTPEPKKTETRNFYQFF